MMSGVKLGSVESYIPIPLGVEFSHGRILSKCMSLAIAVLSDAVVLQAILSRDSLAFLHLRQEGVTQ